MKVKSEDLKISTKSKKIDVAKLEKLAKKIKNYFAEEDEYLEKVGKNENNNGPRILTNP